MKISPTLLGLCVAVSIFTSARSDFQCYNGSEVANELYAVIDKKTVECATKQCIAMLGDFATDKMNVIKGTTQYFCNKNASPVCGDGEDILPKMAPERRKQAIGKGASEMYCCNKTRCNESLKKAKRNLVPSSSTLTPIFIGLLIFFGVYSASN
ncbi:hypothetical protein QR680_010559 [Steinernema hermaphroditum]|uniref:UPAR/Ly6 domain-containing protein n=1 Tax=Steinernema hermaphroditum TaxID=289476 RepID=A0AA39IR95_9BILA|nr:hypothetical protein QR680_010559 [Steinernema hermaphroditum]